MSDEINYTNRKGLAAPLVAWLVANLCLAVFVVTQSRQMPEVVAVHFNTKGVADSWMNRNVHVATFLAFGSLIPATIVGMTAALKFSSSELLSVPNADYWRLPENYSKARRLILKFSLWLAAGLCLWFTLLHHFLYLANIHEPSRLGRGALTKLLVVLGVFLACWVGALYRAFRVRGRGASVA